MENAFERITNYLRQNEVPFRSIDHPSAASAEEYQRTLGTRLEQQAKALFIRYKKSNTKGFAIVALAAQKKADMENVRRLLFAKEVRLGTAEQLKEVTGCGYGELPPFGKMFSVTLLFDKDLLNEKEIYFNAGKLTSSIILNPVDLIKVEEPVLF